jgi:hypothetical protein
MQVSNNAIPYLIARSDFQKFSRFYQLAALALEQTGKVRIVDGVQPSTVSSACVASTEPAPSSDGYRYCAPSPAHGGLVAQEGAEGLPFRASLEGDGGFIRTPPRDGHQPVSLGYYKLIATDTSEYTIMGVQR